MSDEPAPAAVKNARGAALKARQLVDEHQRAHRDADPADAALARRGDELKRLAAQASARFEVVKQQARGSALAKRRQDSIADDAQLQARSWRCTARSPPRPAPTCSSATRTRPGSAAATRNMNGLLRDYFPKGTDLSPHSADELARIAAEINDRPRKTLGWTRPTDLLTAAVATA